jgi:hypothetical protein
LIFTDKHGEHFNMGWKCSYLIKINNSKKQRGEK